MKNRLVLLAGFAIVSVILGVRMRALEQVPATERLRILFIGNSFTFRNNLPEMFAGLANSGRQPRQVEVQMIAPGGATLEEHWKKGDALAAIRQQKWDWVILQEQSLLGVMLVNGQYFMNDPRNFHDFARLFDAEIKARGAKPIFLHTWARQDAQENQQKVLDYAYMSIAAELRTPVIPVGIAWPKLRSESPSLNLYADDGSHPAPAGTYLAACLIYASLFGETPEGLSAEVMGHLVRQGGRVDEETGILVKLDQADARRIQRIAWETHRNLQASGGYLKVKPVTERVSFPTLPKKRQLLRETDLTGTWMGPLAFYSDKAALELRVRKQDQSWTATAVVEIDLPQGTNRYTYAATNFTFNGSEIHFTIVNPIGTGIDEKYQGVFTGDSLSGIAEFGSPTDPPYLLGSWELRRR
jgi:hypothetical protein